MTFINGKKREVHNLWLIKLQEHIKELALKIEGFMVPLILAISLLTAWTGEIYFNENPFQLIENEEEKNSSKTGIESGIEFKTDKEEKLDSNKIVSSLGITCSSIAFLNLPFLSFQQRIQTVIFSKVNIYILYCKLQIDY